MDSFSDSNYIIDLSFVQSAFDVIFEFSTILENDIVKNKKILLKLGNIELNQTQLQSIKSLINSINSNLTIVETQNVQTAQSALSMGLIVENPNVADSRKNEPIAETEIVPVEEKSKPVEEKYIPVEQNKIQEVAGCINFDSYKEEDDDMDSSYDYSPEELGYSIKQNKKINDELDVIFDEERKLDELLEHQPDVGEIENMLKIDAEYTQQDFEIDNLPTMYLKQTLRSGQAVNFDGNIVIIGDAHCGCEINATGDITVWGILSGIAHAGSNGNEKARIRALKMNALQLRIADWYSRRPDGSKNILTEKTSTFEPEEARVVDGVIVLFKINEKIS